MSLGSDHQEQQAEDQARALVSAVTRHAHLEQVQALHPSKLRNGESEGSRALEKSKKEERRTHSDNAAEQEGTAGGVKRSDDQDDHLRVGLSE